MNTGKKANLKMVDKMRTYDNTHWVVDNSEMLKLGWKPEVSLEESIRRMVDDQQRKSN